MLLRLPLILLFLFCALLPAEAKRVALVIGNSAYQNTTVLANPTNDAKLMDKALRDAGFEVTLVLDADKDTMGRALLEFGRTLRKGVDASMFYYAGHGVQVGGENYLVPINATLESEDEVDLQTFPVNAFLRTMESAKSPVNIVVLDACRNNPFSRAFRGTSGGLAPVNAPRGSYIAYATAPGDVAADGEGGNSPYTVALASLLATPGLKLEDVFKKTREKVLASTADSQVPWETSSITGDFYFKDGTAPVVIAPPVVNAAAAEWETVKSSASKAVLEAYRDKYGNEPIYRGLAEEKLALLVPPTPVEPECGGTLTTVQSTKTCLKTGDTFKDCDSCPDMVVVPAGSFMMGSPENEPDRQADEGPQHKVTLRSAFAVGKFEVTKGQFNEFVNDTNYDVGTNCWIWNGTEWKDTPGKSYRSTGFTQTDAHPVACVSWDDAQAYLKWLSKKSGVSYRLLTESEWEYADRAGITAAFPTGTTITTAQANFKAEKSGTTLVGAYAENKFGLFDMAGNVWEWTEDCYEDSYKNASTTGKATQGSSCERVDRGGGWGSEPQILRSASRGRFTTVNRGSFLGFRIARTF
jgi:formylglycine-generating enzyme required for sulfatase activity